MGSRAELKFGKEKNPVLRVIEPGRDLVTMLPELSRLVIGNEFTEKSSPHYMMCGAITTISQRRQKCSFAAYKVGYSLQEPVL